MKLVFTRYDRKHEGDTVTRVQAKRAIGMERINDVLAMMNRLRIRQGVICCEDCKVEVIRK